MPCLGHRIRSRSNLGSAHHTNPYSCVPSSTCEGHRSTQPAQCSRCTRHSRGLSSGSVSRRRSRQQRQRQLLLLRQRQQPRLQGRQGQQQQRQGRARQGMAVARRSQQAGRQQRGRGPPPQQQQGSSSRQTRRMGNGPSQAARLRQPLRRQHRMPCSRGEEGYGECELESPHSAACLKMNLTRFKAVISWTCSCV